MKKLVFIFPLIFLVAQGCGGPKFIVTIDSIRDPEVVSKTNYILLPGEPKLNTADLQYREYSTYVVRALASRGYVKATTLEEADIAIFFSYGIGDPEERQYTYSVPTWGQTGVSSSSTHGTINTVGNTGIYSSTTTHTPSYGITGSTTHLGSYTIYSRHMILDAIDFQEFRKTKNIKKIWKTIVTSSGSSGDLRVVLPILVGAAKDYIGTDTGKKIDIRLLENDERVIEVKGLKQ